MEQTHDPDVLAAVQTACIASRPRPQHGDLLQRLAACVPGLVFEHRISRGGWFRLGGVISATGERIAEDLQAWAEAAWEAAEDEGARLAAACRGQTDEADLRLEIGLPPGADAPVATRIAGTTHYFVARYGGAPESFIQLEIEELREVTSHRLGETGVPDSVEAFVAPAREEAEGRPVGAPSYRFRRMHDIARLMARLALQLGGEPSGALRFVSDWSRSRASVEALSEHWLMQISDWRDRYGVERIGMKPMAVREFLHPPAPESGGGGALGGGLQEYDRRAGYPMAWYFDMVAGRGIPGALAESVLLQWDDGYRYLSERDMACVREFGARPYRA